jgi:Na+/H+ antiporter NhaB
MISPPHHLFRSQICKPIRQSMNVPLKLAGLVHCGKSERYQEFAYTSTLQTRFMVIVKKLSHRHTSEAAAKQ